MKRDEPDVFAVDDDAALPATPREVIAILEPLVAEGRRARIEAVLRERTRDVVLVLDDLADPHNASAILRTADALGVQEVHVIERHQRLAAAHRVARGAERWLDVRRHGSGTGAVRALAGAGYTVAYATMTGALEPDALAALPRVALVFGNEHRGVAADIQRATATSFRVPMVGFVESLNVSVAAAISVHAALRGRARGLPDIERVRAKYLMASVDRAELVVTEALKRPR